MCYENYWNLVALVVICPTLVGGWYAVRRRVMNAARERDGVTDSHAIITQTPLAGAVLQRQARGTAHDQPDELRSTTDQSD